MSLPLELGSLHKEQQALDSLERQLICPICLEVFTKPVVILPCQHNLCRKCANDLYQARSNLVGAGGRFRCPSCRQEVTLDRHGVYGLQRNLLVENIIDVYKQESTSSRPPPKPTGKLTCEEHEDEMVNIYCLSCQVPTCSLCKVFGAHKSCQVAPLPEIYQQQKAELSDGIDLLVAANDRVQAFINELEETCSNVEHNSKSQKQTLVEKFDRMYAILEERRKIMTQRITYEQEEKTGHARSLVRSYGESVEVSTKLVEAALHTIVEPEQAAFLQSAKGMIEKVIEATGSSTVETLEPGYENMDHYKVNFNAEERALYQLDFIKVVEEVPEDPEPEPESDPEPEPECEPDLELEPEPILEYQAAPAPVAASVSSLILEPESVLEHLAMPVPVAAPVSSLILEPESVLEHLAMPVPVAAPVAAPVPILVSAPEPVVEPKPEGWGIKDQGAELTEDVRSQAESYADPTKEVLCDQEGFDTQQDEPGPEAEAETELWQEGHDAAGDCDIQEGLLADISEDTRLLYPSWYKSSSWQVVSPPSSLATSNIEPLDVPESTPQPAREAQPQALSLSLPQPQPLPSHMPMSVWMDNSYIPMPPDDQARELTWESTGTGSLVVGPHGFVPPAGEGTPGLGERAAGSGGSVTSMTSTPLQGLSPTVGPQDGRGTEQSIDTNFPPSSTAPWWLDM